MLIKEASTKVRNLLQTFTTFHFKEDPSYRRDDKAQINKAHHTKPILC